MTLSSAHRQEMPIFGCPNNWTRDWECLPNCKRKRKCFFNKETSRPKKLFFIVGSKFNLDCFLFILRKKTKAKECEKNRVELNTTANMFYYKKNIKKDKERQKEF